MHFSREGNEFTVDVDSFRLKVSKTDKLLKIEARSQSRMYMKTIYDDKEVQTFTDSLFPGLQSLFNGLSYALESAKDNAKVEISSDGNFRYICKMKNEIAQCTKSFSLKLELIEEISNEKADDLRVTQLEKRVQELEKQLALALEKNNKINQLEDKLDKLENSLKRDQILQVKNITQELESQRLATEQEPKKRVDQLESLMAKPEMVSKEMDKILQENTAKISELNTQNQKIKDAFWRLYVAFQCEILKYESSLDNGLNRYFQSQKKRFSRPDITFQDYEKEKYQWFDQNIYNRSKAISDITPQIKQLDEKIAAFQQSQNTGIDISTEYSETCNARDKLQQTLESLQSHLVSTKRSKDEDQNRDPWEVCFRNL